MGGRSAPKPEPAAPIEPPKPVPLPNANANADKPSGEAAPSYATQQEATKQNTEEQKGLGTTSSTQTRRRPARDAASMANSASGGGLAAPAVITG